MIYSNLLLHIVQMANTILYFAIQGYILKNQKRTIPKLIFKVFVSIL